MSTTATAGTATPAVERENTRRLRWQVRAFAVLTMVGWAAIGVILCWLTSQLAVTQSFWGPRHPGDANQATEWAVPWATAVAVCGAIDVIWLAVTVAWSVDRFGPPRRVLLARPDQAPPTVVVVSTADGTDAAGSGDGDHGTGDGAGERTSGGSGDGSADTEGQNT